jgi:hypothetical protein
MASLALFFIAGGVVLGFVRMPATATRERPAQPAAAPAKPAR